MEKVCSYPVFYYFYTTLYLVLMEILATRQYPIFLIDITRFPILLFFFPVFFFDKDVFFIGYIFIFYIILAQLKYKFTTRIHLDGGRLIIQYKWFFIQREKVIGLRGMVMTMQDYRDVIIRGSSRTSNHLLTILVNGKKVYSVDTREGYTKEEFLELMTAVGKAPVLE